MLHMLHITNYIHITMLHFFKCVAVCYHSLWILRTLFSSYFCLSVGTPFRYIIRWLRLIWPLWKECQIPYDQLVLMQQGHFNSFSARKKSLSHKAWPPNSNKEFVNKNICPVIGSRITAFSNGRGFW